MFSKETVLPFKIFCQWDWNFVTSIPWEKWEFHWHEWLHNRKITWL